MTHEVRLLSFIPKRLPSSSCGDRWRVNSEYKLSMYSDSCEHATMQARSIACMLFRFKR